MFDQEEVKQTKSVDLKLIQQCMVVKHGDQLELFPNNWIYYSKYSQMIYTDYVTKEEETPSSRSE